MAYESKLKRNPIKCTLQDAAIAWLGTSKRWIELQELFNKQLGKCYYSGLPIEIRKNAQLDHTVPRNRGGENTIDNLRWVHEIVNQMKSDIPEDQFLQFCATVAEHQIKVKTCIR